MALSNVDRGEKLEACVNRLFAEIDRLKASNTDLLGKLDALKQQIVDAQREAADAKRELDVCKLGLALRRSDGIRGSYTPTEAKRRISQIVRELDRCITLLKK